MISNGTAVLGLGNIGAAAGKPVMEGKACLFKKFADIDVFDLEIAETDVDKFVDIVAALEPTFGGINLEDIAAPECFEIEEKLRERMRIPVFHDDQHGTAIISGAGLLNAAELASKQLADLKLVVSGAGAGAIACVDFFCQPRRARARTSCWSTRKGVIHAGRTDLNRHKAKFAIADDGRRTLADAMRGADMFMGLSVAGTVHAGDAEDDGRAADHLRARQPRSGDLAIPTRSRRAPTRSSRPAAATSRTRSTTCSASRTSSAARSTAARRGVNEAMKLAAARALAELAREPVPDSVISAYGGKSLKMGPDYFIPKPFDPRVAVVGRAGGREGGDGVAASRASSSTSTSTASG